MVVTCAVGDCKKQAVMYCVNCGKPVCEKHVVHGRFCSEECYAAMGRQKVAAEPTKRVIQKGERRMFAIVGAIALLLTVTAIVYFILTLLGV